VWNGIQLSIHAECCTRTPWVWRWHPGWNGGHVSLQAHTSQWPLAWLSGLGAPWNTLGLQGQMRLQHADMQWSWRAGQAMLQGSGEMTLQNVSSDLSTLKPLGDYALSLQGGPQPELQLRSLQARLQLQGRGGWRDGHWYLNGEAQADRAYEQVLGNLLGVLGQRQGHKAIFQWG
jgi:general secretion pathway protein N